MKLLIVGASARAAAASAVRAGLNVHTIDLFADHDLARVASAQRVASNYPQEAAEMALRLPPMAWMFTGGFENHSGLIEQVSRRHRMRGPTPADIVRVRNFTQLADSLSGSPFRFPASFAESSGSIESPGRRPDAKTSEQDEWLLKPIASCGGSHIQFARRAGSVATNQIRQRYVEGTSYSVSFLTNGFDCQLLGVTRQWLARDSAAYQTKAAVSPFAYVASVGPLPEVAREHSWRELGQRMVDKFRMRGVFGVDVVISNDGVPFVLEVNPRYTASMECIEAAFDLPIVQLHVEASEGRMRSVRLPDEASVYGKAYYFAQSQVTFDECVDRWVQRQLPLTSARPSVADIPRLGSVIEPNQPVLTVFARESDELRVSTALGLTGEQGLLAQLGRQLDASGHVVG